MNALKVFILIGTIDSHDGQFATVELSLNPATNGGAASAVMPVSAFPCEIKEGSKFFVVKLTEEEDAIIVCAAEEEPKK
tara:strand:- start:1556 stop:1792 length:237 start_codon:yes stop_codon:yes gene_type:complete